MLPLNEAAVLRSIVLRYAGVPIATRVSFFLFLTFFVYLEMSLFPSIFCTISTLYCIESTSYVLSYTGKLAIANGSVEFCEATPIGLVDEPKVSLYGCETDRDLRSACRCDA